jgi:hypothetical protein
LEVDASQYATGAILYQADPKLKDQKGNPLLRPCGYHAQTFSAAEQWYPIYDREFLAIMRGLIHWDYLLQAPRPAPTIVITDHANLQYYRHPHKIGPRVAGYISTMEDYLIALMYKPGKTNRMDVLSRWPDFAPDPYNDKPVLVLPEDLFVKPTAPVIEVGTYPYSTAKHLIRACGITFNDKVQIRVYKIDDEIHSSLVEGEVMAAQEHNPKSLELWAEAHGIEQRTGGLSPPCTGGNVRSVSVSL